MPTPYRAVRALLLGASAVVLVCVSAHALPVASAPNARPGLGIDAPPPPQPSQARYRLAQYGDDDGPSDSGPSDDGPSDDGPSSSPSSDDDGPSPSYRGPSSRGPSFNFNIPFNIGPGRQQRRPQYVPRERIVPAKKREKKPKPIIEKKKVVVPVRPPKPPRKIVPAYVIPPPPVPPDVDPVPPPDDCPDNFPDLRVGKTVLSPYRTNLPAEAARCKGMTAKGCYLRVLNGPPGCGGSRPTCVMHCPPDVPIIVPRIVVPDTKPETPAVPTDYANPVIQPEPKQPETPAVPTDYANPVIQPEPKRPETPAVPTDYASPVIQPEPKRPETPAVPTDYAKTVVEPEPKRPPETPAVPTDHATPVTHAGLKPPPETPAVPTDHAKTVVHPEPKRPPKSSAVPTDSDFGFDMAIPDTPPPTVPVDGKGCTPQGVGLPSARFKSDPDYARTIVTSAVGAIPTVGGPLGALTKFLWKDGQPNSLFNQMKDYVDKLVPEALTDAKLTDMQHRLKAITDDLHLYDNMVGTEKPGRLIHALGAINDNTEDFVADDGVNRAAPDRTLSYFVNFALLKLAALQEQLVKDKEYWPDQDGKTYAQAHDTRQKELYDAIKQVTDRAAEIKKKLMERRLEKLFVKNDGYETTIGAQDEFGWAQRDEVKFSLARDDFCDWNGPSYDNHNNPAARADLARRRDEVTKAYGAAVDAILEPLNAWRALLPEEIARRERERQELDRQRRQAEYEQIQAETCRGIAC